MKKLLLVFCLFSILASSQTSSYNKGLKKTSIVTSEWFLDKGAETYFTNQKPVGFKNSYDELKKILNFYNLDITEAEIDESLIDKSVESLHDFQNLSNSLLIEWSVINMTWRCNDGFQICWICSNDINLILIKKIK
jgi:hypothetical protein